MGRVTSHTLIDATASLSTDWTSDSIPLSYMDGYSIQLVFTGVALEGTFWLEVSADPTSPTNWSLFKNSEQLIAEGGDHVWNVADAGHNFVRVCWTNVAGTGSLTSAKWTAKGV